MARGQRLLQDATPSDDPLPIQAAFRFISNNRSAAARTRDGDPLTLNGRKPPDVLGRQLLDPQRRGHSLSRFKQTVRGRLRASLFPQLLLAGVGTRFVTA
jgi:hypothetical protein